MKIINYPAGIDQRIVTQRLITDYFQVIASPGDASEHESIHNNTGISKANSSSPSSSKISTPKKNRTTPAETVHSSEDESEPERKVVIKKKKRKTKRQPEPTTDDHSNLIDSEFSDYGYGESWESEYEGEVGPVFYRPYCRCTHC
ncbi:hypothetical protein BDZ45DRAFT_691203 [Acephala macrosclerotiorum]|nr:hypothetical protein BDZ45DRAFT_691203 [Acephala macrosclerotiorum]